MKTTAPLWAFTGAVSAFIAPLLILTVGRLLPEKWLAARVPAVVIGPAFVVLHGSITFALLLKLALWQWVVLHLTLFAGATLYWLPVIGSSDRLEGGRPFVYLVATSPLLDLAGFGVVLFGRASGGVAMILAMLPLNLYAVWLLWRWMVREEERTDVEIQATTTPGAVPVRYHRL